MDNGLQAVKLTAFASIGKAGAIIVFKGERVWFLTRQRSMSPG
jgi:hypothetical protein